MSVKSAEARAEVFWTAFRAMGREERHAFLERLLADEPTRRDLLDAALIEERKGEPRRRGLQNGERRDSSLRSE